MSSQLGGTQLVTADAAVGTSGVPVRVKMIHILSAATGAVVSLRNGTSASGTVYVTETGTANTGKTVYFGDSGVVFPAGCFVDVDGNTTSVAVTYAGVQ